MFFEDSDVTLEVRVDEHEILYGDVEYVDIADGVIVIISQLDACASVSQK